MPPNLLAVRVATAKHPSTMKRLDQVAVGSVVVVTSPLRAGAYRVGETNAHAVTLPSLDPDRPPIIAPVSQVVHVPTFEAEADA